MADMVKILNFEPIKTISATLILSKPEIKVPTDLLGTTKVRLDNFTWPIFLVVFFSRFLNAHGLIPSMTNSQSGL